MSNRQVMREFIFAWERAFPDDELVVAVRTKDIASARAELPARVELVGTRLPQQGLGAVVELPFVGRRVRADVVLTHNFTPLFGRSAVFVHDVMFTTHPEWFTAAERAYFSLMPLLLPRARWVLTSSATEARRIAAGVRGNPPVSAVGLGLVRGLVDSEPERPDGLGDIADFSLAVGRINVRKNLATAVAAAVESGVATPSRPLIVVGAPDGRRADLGDAVRDAVARGAVLFLGFIDDAELAWLYSHAHVFLFLSLDEGFGMPTLEATHFGATVVASDIPVFREILSDRAAYVSPLDVGAAAEAIAVAFAAERVGPIDVESLGYSWELSVRRMRQAIAG